MKRFIVISALIIILFVFISQCTSQKIVGHRYEIKGQYYDYNPTVPLIEQTNNGVDSELSDMFGVTSLTGFANYNDFYNHYDYKCRGLKDEGTTAHTIAQAAAAGTASREQMLNFYYTTKGAMQREEDCQESIHLFRQYLWTIRLSNKISNWDQIHNELNTNMDITMRDEEIERTSYNNIASNFNNAIISCSNSNKVLGTEGMCHDICVAPNIYCK